MKRIGLTLLRVSTGWLLVLWGLDKFLDTNHSVRVAEAFYLGLWSQATVLKAFGVAEVLLGLLVVVGLWRRRVYPVMTLVLGITALGVWKSILDPWGWVLDGTNVLFYPSLIIIAAAITLWGTIAEDTMCLDARRRGA